MPPRLPRFQCLHVQNVSQAPSYSRTFASSSSAQASTVTQRRRHQDPYAIAQAKARKAANISRQQVLTKERVASLGDPIRGITTPYIQSFDTAVPQDTSAPSTRTKTRIKQSPDEDALNPPAEKDEHLNFFLSKSELEAGVKHSQWLSTPTTLPPEQDADALTSDQTQEEKLAQQKEDQANAEEALHRISSLSLGSSKDRLRLNIQRCITDFGRHTTDKDLSPRPASVSASNAPGPTKTPRVGPDTGSSEVQIAILTAKIRTLADFLESRGRMDKANRRNLTLLVHRRAKLLKYLRRKERGGPRWENLVQTLGLVDGTWKGEITLGRDLRAVGQGLEEHVARR